MREGRRRIEARAERGDLFVVAGRAMRERLRGLLVGRERDGIHDVALVRVDEREHVGGRHLEEEQLQRTAPLLGREVLEVERPGGGGERLHFLHVERLYRFREVFRQTLMGVTNLLPGDRLGDPNRRPTGERQRHSRNHGHQKDELGEKPHWLDSTAVFPCSG